MMVMSDHHLDTVSGQAGIEILAEPLGLEIDAIRVGQAIGSGPSLGAIGLHGLVAHIEGQVQIYYH